MSTRPKLLVCGGRDYHDRWHLETVLDEICLSRNWLLGGGIVDGNWLANVVLICGMAKGADLLAYDWAVSNWCEIEEYPADWETHGRRAGYIRNKQMLDEGKPDLVVAFPGGKGTEMMVKIAKEAGVEVIRA